MKLNQLGQTDIAVSCIGLGTVKFGRNTGVKYPRAFSLPTDQAILHLLEAAKSLGINLLDTAPAYGASEERLGALLKGQRHEWIISTKAGESFHEGHSTFDFSPRAIQKSIENSLKKLNTDYLDIVFIHSDGDDVKLIQQDHVFETLDALKKAGKIRAYGMSTKTVEGGLLAVKYSDVVMVTYHPEHLDELVVIKEAHQQKKGIFIKKAFASGHFKHSIQEIMQFIFKEAGVTSVIVGTLKPEHLRENVICLPTVP
ncbi:MAG: aldo/keto reductase [Gammaproteobacteria bacterium]|nr:aldo/keto reductase [Gammaproteobacteria bacterium]